MKKNLTKILLVALSLIGMIDASYISFETLLNKTPACSPPFACTKVLDSQWAYVAGIPLSVYGLVFYLIMFVLSIVYFTDLKSNFYFFKQVGEKIKLLASLGFAFSVYLVSLMAFVIKAWCLWCLISAITTTLLFGVSRLIDKAQNIKTTLDTDN
jgi:uncharacterized membrane protein